MLNALRNSTPIRANLRQAFDPGRATRRTVSRAVLCWIVLGLSLIAGGAEGRLPQTSHNRRQRTRSQETKEAVESTKQYTLQTERIVSKKTFQAGWPRSRSRSPSCNRKPMPPRWKPDPTYRRRYWISNARKTRREKQFDEVSQSTSSGWNKLKENLNHARRFEEEL